MAGHNAGLSAQDSMPDGRPGQRPADHGAPIPHTASRTVLAVLRKWNVGTAIAIMLWIYFTAAILLFGAVITSVTTVPRSVPLGE